MSYNFHIPVLILNYKLDLYSLVKNEYYNIVIGYIDLYSTFPSNPIELVVLPFPLVDEWNLPSSLPPEFPADAEEFVADDEDAEDWELLPGGGLELKFPCSCMERKYLVAACLSCSRSSAVCLLKSSKFRYIPFISSIQD